MRTVVRTVGLTPLIMAFNSLSTEIIFLITDDLGPKDMSSLLRTARRFDTVLSAKFYGMALTYTRTTGETVLLWAALRNREATFKSLLERGIDVLIQDKAGDTVLHHLARKGTLYLLTLLLVISTFGTTGARHRCYTPSRRETKRLLTSFYKPVQTLRLCLPLDLKVRPVDNSSWNSVKIIEYEYKSRKNRRIH